MDQYHEIYFVLGIIVCGCLYLTIRSLSPSQIKKNKIKPLYLDDESTIP